MPKTIEVTTAGAVEPGDYIDDPDTDNYDQDFVNSDYDAEEQDWKLVVDRRGHADVGQLLLQDYDGGRHWVAASWSAPVWRLLGDDGEPVKGEL